MATTIAEPIPLSNGKAAIPNDYIWRLSVEQYHEMIDAGILTEDDPVELLEGLLVLKMPKNPPHTLSTDLTAEALTRVVRAGWFVSAQQPLTTEDSEPEPDVKVVRGQRRHYGNRHPGPADLALVVEVADSSLRRDRGWKKRLYAAAKIPVYWIINLIDRQVEVFTEPTSTRKGARYRPEKIYKSSEQVPVVIDGKQVGRIAVRDLLP